MKEIEISTGEYTSKWGLTDWYPEAEEKLQEALASGEDFDTGWFGCKKEIRYARIVREEGEIEITVAAHMDDLWEEDDLIYDALWKTCHVEEELPEEIIDSIRDAAIWDHVEDYTELSVTLPAASTFEEITEALGKLEDEAEENNTEMYKTLCEIVKGQVDYMNTEVSE